MATLEKIRKKSVLLLIIIGGALLAFILGDLLNNQSIFGRGTTVAEVNGTEIDYLKDFQELYAQASENSAQQGNREQDAAVLQNQVLQQLIMKTLMDQEYDDLAIDVTDAELSDYMFKVMPMQDRNFAQFIQSLAQQMSAKEKAASLLSNSASTDAMVQNIHKIVFNPTAFGFTNQDMEGVKAAWINYENNAAEQLKNIKFQRLLFGSLYANALERESLKERYNNSYAVKTVMVPYVTIDDKDYAVNDAEINAAYDSHKEMFAIDQELRRAYFIAVPVAPSDNDLAEADKFLAKVDSTLKATTGIDAVRNMGELTVEEKEYRKNELSRGGVGLAEFADSVAVMAVSKVYNSADDRIIYRLLNKTEMADSATLVLVQVAGDKKHQDEVLATLNSGKSIDEIVKADSTVVANPDSVKIDLVNYVNQGSMTADQRSKVINAGADFFVFDNNAQGAIIAKVVGRGGVKTIYNVAKLTYKVAPSKTTRQNLLNDLQKYVDANNNAQAFFDNASKSEQHYQAQSVILSSDQPMIGGIKSTAKLVKWLFTEAEKGEVSAIQTEQNNDNLVVVALADIYDGDYIPVTDSDVKAQCETFARNEKKGNALVKKYGNVKDINAFAAATGKPAQTMTIGGGRPAFEPMLGGRVSLAKAGQFYGPLKGESSVFGFVVEAKNPAAADKKDDKAVSDIYLQYLYREMQMNFYDLIKGEKEVKNNIVDFR